MLLGSLIESFDLDSKGHGPYYSGLGRPLSVVKERDIVAEHRGASPTNQSAAHGGLDESVGPIGGQALLEGVMMRRGASWGAAVRRTDGTIGTLVSVG